MRKFDDWFAGFKASISNYGYYVNFEKIHRNVESVKVELNILNSLIGSKDIGTKFEELLIKYPACLKCIPLLLAIRNSEIQVMDGNTEFRFSFHKKNYSIA